MFHFFRWLLPLTWDTSASIPIFGKEKSFLHNLQLALAQAVDFDTQDDILLSFNQALAKKVFFVFGVILIT